MDLSIVIPVYNTPQKYLEECLKSIEDSKIGFSYELIFVNDGSTDENTLQFLHQIDLKNAKILHKENGGASSARNLGLKNAVGEFILCLDADDILLPSINGYIQFLKEHSDYSVAYGDWKIFGDMDYQYQPGKFSSFRHIYLEIQPHTTSVFRRSVLEKVQTFNENFKVSEDWDFWARVSVAGFKFHYMKEPLFLWRRINDGKSLSQKDSSRTIRNQVLETGKKQFNAHQEITLKSVNEYVLNSFKEHKLQFFKLFLILYLPFIYKILLKMKVFKNDIVID